MAHKNQSLVTEATRRSTTKGSSKSAEKEKKKEKPEKKTRNVWSSAAAKQHVAMKRTSGSRLLVPETLKGRLSQSKAKFTAESLIAFSH